MQATHPHCFIRQNTRDMSCYEEIRDALSDALHSERKIEEILQRAKDRGRFGLFDVLKAYAVLESVETVVAFRPKKAISKLAFMRTLARVFPLNDVDLWCMSLEENASSVAGSDSFGDSTETCALFLSGAFITMEHGFDGVLTASTFAAMPYANSARRRMAEELDTEILLRTIPIAVAANRESADSYSGSWQRVRDCRLLQEPGALSKETLLRILGLVVGKGRGLDASVIYQSAAMSVFFSESLMSETTAYHCTKALLSFKSNEPGSQSDIWISDYGHNLRPHSKVIIDILQKCIKATNTMHWPRKISESRSMIACLCALLSPWGKRQMADALHAHSVLLNGDRFNRRHNEKYVSRYIPEAIEACAVHTKSAAM